MAPSRSTTFVPRLFSFILIAAVALASLTLATESHAATVSGSLKKWQAVIVDFDGPNHNELDNSPNPFLDYRLEVTFTAPSGAEYTIPGYFDGNGNGGANGDVWRARFAPDESGTWSYEASFRSGSNIAVSLSANAGQATSFDGETGTFNVGPRDLAAEGFLSTGRLEYDGTHYLKLRDGGYWLKMGSNSPENFLGYDGFDRTPNANHDYSEFNNDWNSGDPQWDSPDASGSNNARGIIGLLNYWAEQHVNSIYFLTMNIGGQGQDTWPYAGNVFRGGSSSNDNTHIDLSKMRQWEIVFEHAQRKEIMLHFVLADRARNLRLELDGGQLGTERKLYFRELIARFGHHNALQWNLSEEYDHPQYVWSVSLMRDFAEYISALDAYEHPLTIHNDFNTYPDTLTPFYGDPNFDVFSVQTYRRPDEVDFALELLRDGSAAAGRPLAVNVDEPTSVSWSGMGTVNDYRKRVTWDALMSGGGHELFVSNETVTDNFRQFEDYYEDAWYARRFFEENLPFWDMEPRDDLLTGEDGLYGGGEVIADVGEVYAVYLPRAGSNPQLSMSGASGQFRQRWYNPRNGSFEGSDQTFNAGSSRSLGSPPSSSSEDWVVLIERASAPNADPEAVSAGVTVTEDDDVAITLGGSDPDGDPLSFSIAMTPSHGGLAGSPPAITYSPAPNYNGPDAFTFQVSDGRGGTDLGTIDIDVIPAPDAPTAEDVSAATFEETPVDVVLEGGDADGDPISFEVVELPSSGTLVPAGVSAVTYTPEAGFTGVDSFRYVADDGGLQSAPALAAISVIATGGGTLLFADAFDRPDSGSAGTPWTEREPGSTEIVVNDGALWFQNTEDAAFAPAATAVFDALGARRLRLAFDMDWTRSGTENTYALRIQLGDSGSMSDSDPDAGIAASLLWSRIGGVHETLAAELSGGDQALGQVSGPASIVLEIDLDASAYSVLIDGAIAASGLAANSGAANIDAVRFVTDGVNDANFSGRRFDNVVVTKQDGPVEENEPPSADDASIALSEDTTAPVTLSATDPDGDPITYSIVSGPSLGTLSGTPPALTYQPFANANGIDSFTFRASDGRGGSDDGTVGIAIAAVNDPPAASGASVSTLAGEAIAITLSATDIDSPSLSFQIVGGPTGGTLTDAADGDADLTYTPNAGFEGNDSFTFVANDGTDASNVATVNISVSSVPVASDLFVEPFDRPDSASLGNGWSEQESGGVSVTLEGGRMVFTTTGDVVRRPMAVRSFEASSSGLLTWAFTMDWTRLRKESTYGVRMQIGDGSTFDPNDTSNGAAVDLVWARVSGTHQTLAADAGGSLTPLAVAIGSTEVEVTIDLDAGTYDVSVDGTQEAAGLPLGATTIDTVRFFTDGLNEGFFAGRAFDDIYVAREGGAPPDPDNTPPTATAATLAVDEDDAAGITLAGSDADGDPLTFSIVSGPANGTLTGNPPSVTYSPDPNYNGSDAFTFRVDDGRGGSDTAVVSVSVAPVNDPPSATPGSAATLVDTPVVIALSGSDIDGDALSFSIATPPASGALGPVGAGGSVTYTPDAGFTGSDSFTFVANDGTTTGAPATVTIEVTAVPVEETLLMEDFTRPNSASVGNGWSENEAADTAVEILDNRLFFADTSDKTMRPAASRSFPAASSGVVQWRYTMDWTRLRKEGAYAVRMQLGNAAAMSPDDPGAGIAVHLIWARVSGTHQTLAAVTPSGTTSLAVVSGETDVEVALDLGASTFSVAVDGVTVGSGLAAGAAPAVDTVRFVTDGLNEQFFSGRSFDSVVVERVP